ncbi:hypothetical protein BGW36DRAFT_357594 [Talaromyces proteolyticus]|uniref:Uncharacterized protein n=1 Tax=Talaromyces proteolyticus TaxID=1131652 RepID=A0AAD4Q314_9EURO|nr:uncharacterized protein BGW36DRAFT_357594 [Talaromyces proteolyticus]KAH8700957.1 hypothetical protein BGW36DRAFT_357594 [Talaromyces proteolyticus]
MACKAVVLFLLQLTVVHASIAQERFSHFYPSMNWVLLPVSTETCNSTLQKYLSSGFQPATANLCYAQIRCILSNLPEEEKAVEASAAVLLGIIPTFLASLGPTIPEMSLLASRRPILAIFLAIGCVSVSITRFAEYSSPLQVLDAKPGNFATKEIQSHRRKVIISSFQYMLAFGACVNVIYCSYTVGTYTVLNWKCQNSFMPMLWTLLPLVVHVIAASAFRISPAGKKFSQISDSKMKKPNSVWGRLVYMLRQEATPCAAQEMPMDLKEADGFTVVSLQWLASGAGFAHILFGTMVLSSLLFIGMLEALSVAAQYIGSVLVCRFILMFELAGMRRLNPMSTI